MDSYLLSFYLVQLVFCLWLGTYADSSSLNIAGLIGLPGFWE